MKSKLFSTREFSDRFMNQLRIDLPNMIKIPLSDIEKAIEYLPEFFITEKKELYEKISSNLASEISVTPVEATHLLGILYVFAQFLIDETLAGDQKLWASDLVELGLLSDDKKDQINKILSSFPQELITKLKDISKQDSYRKGILPYFVDCDYTIEERFVFDKDYEYGTDVNKYQPVLMSKIPIITVRLRTDTDTENRKEDYFQASPEDIQYIINKLYSSLRSLNLG